MRNIELRKFMTVTLAILMLMLVFNSSKYSQDIYSDDISAMPEPFSSGPLITYSKLEWVAMKEKRRHG